MVVARALKKPEQLIDDGLEVHLLGGHQGKAFSQIKAHLVAKNAAGAGAGAIGLGRASGMDMAQELLILGTHRAGLHGRQCVVKESAGLMSLVAGHQARKL